MISATNTLFGLTTIGENSGANRNTVVVDGSASRWNVASTLRVGKSGRDNVLGINNSAVVNAGSVILGSSGGISNVVRLRGGSLLTDHGVTVNNTCRLEGYGLVAGAVTIASGGILSPGITTGILTNIGNVTFNSGSIFAAEVNGTTPGTQHDQLVVQGSVTLNNATLNVTPGFAPAFYTEVVIIENDGADPVSGQFNGLPEGATVAAFGGVGFAVSYVGGTGNDVVLIAVPSGPIYWTGDFQGAGDYQPDGVAGKLDHQRHRELQRYRPCRHNECHRPGPPESVLSPARAVKRSGSPVGKVCFLLMRRIVGLYPKGTKMKNIAVISSLLRFSRVMLIVLLAMLPLAGLAQEGVVIESFDSSGQMVFDRVTNAVSYRVEWSSGPGQPWTNSWDSLTNFPGAGSGSITASVPMLYRVVATVTNPPLDYLIVDLAAGPAASSYPVSSLPAVPVGGWTDEYKTTKLVFRRIPAGTFTMGSPEDELGRVSDEFQHEVTISQPFHIGVFEVTQKQWERVMGYYPSYFTNLAHRDSRPVEQVSYNTIRGTTLGTNWPASSSVDADTFMGRLRARTGLAFDLPTESQWEYAGRAGTVTALNSGFNLTNTGVDASVNLVGRYWFNGGLGNTPNGDASVGTAKAGSYVPNAWGLYDIHGNVWEWCLDWYETDPGTATDPLGPTSGSFRARRGGNWGGSASDCRSARRGSSSPGGAGFILGFRAALPPSPAAAP